MSNLRPGLVSVTFRQLSPEQIIALATQAQVEWLEWGGDVHVPPGDVERARDVGVMTRNAGLTVAAYGSYYRAGASLIEDFTPVLETALALKAPLVRVWAGSRGSGEATETEREAVVRDARRVCDLAAPQGMQIAFEFHGGTLVDSSDAALRLIAAVDRPNLRTLWQPLGAKNPQEHRLEVEQLLPYLANVHVYHWDAGKSLPLNQGESIWRSCLAELSRADRPIGLLLEFVRDGSPEQFLSDAKTLRTWLAD